MTYQYLFCPSCDMRRVGHAHQCSVCGGPLRRYTPARQLHREPLVLRPRTADEYAQAPERDAVAA